MKLSILVATVDGRESLLSRLLWTLEQQLTDEVEVIVCGGWTGFGTKVNQMRQIAKGDFTVVVDDDDNVTPDYIEKVLPLLTEGIDYLDYGVLHTEDGKFNNVLFSKVPFVVHHKCPVRNSIAKNIPMGDGYHDDRAWSAIASSSVGTKGELNRYMYLHEYWDTGTVGTEPTGKNQDNQRDVGTYPYNKEKFVWL